ncbi:hypothetical protein MMC17_005967 [Xylographa soralifera]|nr:hypothetical protein [Xylographa soralifera]
MFPPQYFQNGPQYPGWQPRPQVQSSTFNRGLQSLNPPNLPNLPFQQPNVSYAPLGIGWHPPPQIQNSAVNGGLQAPNPPVFPFQQLNVFHPPFVAGWHPPPQIQSHIFEGGFQALYPPIYSPNLLNPLPVTGSYLPPHIQRSTFEEGAYAPCPPVSLVSQNIIPNPLLVTTQGQHPAWFQENPLRADIREPCPQIPPMRDITGSRADLVPQAKIPPSASKELDYANFSAADLRYCSIPYSQDRKQPEALFPVRHPIMTPSSPRPLSWYEWANNLPLPHIFRREIRRIEWLDIDVTRKGTSKKAEECFVTVTIMVEELSPRDREVVDRLAGVLQAQGYNDVRVEVAVYWCSVVDAFPDEYMRGLEKLMVGGLTNFLGH